MNEIVQMSKFAQLTSDQRQEMIKCLTNVHKLENDNVESTGCQTPPTRRQTVKNDPEMVM